MKAHLVIIPTVLFVLILFIMVPYGGCKKEEKKAANPCDGIVCPTHGWCRLGACVCDTGYEGSNCDILSRDKLIGTYTGIIVNYVYSGSHVDTLLNHTIHITANASDERKIDIEDLKDSTIHTSIVDRTDFSILEPQSFNRVFIYYGGILDTGSYRFEATQYIGNSGGKTEFYGNK